MRFLKAVPQLIATPALVLGGVALALYLLGNVPGYIYTPEHGPREYASIEEAEADLGFEVVTPRYFPSYLAWPPAEIRGQHEPTPRVQVLFLSYYGGSRVMVISQVKPEGEELQVPLPWVETVMQETAVSIGNNEGFMITGSGAGGQVLNGAYWKAENFYHVVVTTRSARELLTIIRSM